MGGGTLVFEVGYPPRKKIHLIRVVFQDKAMYARTLFRGVKTCKIGKKGCVFGHIDKFWKGHNGQIKKNACKNMYLGSIFIRQKYMFRVCFESPFTRMISSLKYKWPPGLDLQMVLFKGMYTGAWCCSHIKSRYFNSCWLSLSNLLQLPPTWGGN